MNLFNREVLPQGSQYYGIQRQSNIINDIIKQSIPTNEEISALYEDLQNRIASYNHDY